MTHFHFHIEDQAIVEQGKALFPHMAENNGSSQTHWYVLTPASKTIFTPEQQVFLDQNVTNVEQVEVENIVSLDGLKNFYTTLPEGTTCNLSTTDLESGNFNEASFELPSGEIVEIRYYGEVGRFDRGQIASFRK